VKAVFLTGASGFIGSHTCRVFIANGWFVYALIHRHRPYWMQEHISAGRLSTINENIHNRGSIGKLLKEHAASNHHALMHVIHCAGRASDVGRRSAFREANFEAVQSMAKLTRELGGCRLIHVSTTDVYGMRDFNGETEDELPMQMTAQNPYPEFKIAAERWLEANMPLEQYAVIRPAAVWGPGDTTLTPRIIAFLRHSPFIIHFGPWRGKNRWPLAHVDTVAQSIHAAAATKRFCGKAINVLDDQRTSIDSFYRQLAAEHFPGKRFRTLYLPRRTGTALGNFISAISNTLNLDRPFTDPSRYAVYSVSHNLDFSNSRMHALLRKYPK
jgi:nucleoside-diphosphate-sugar epimerase